MLNCWNDGAGFSNWRADCWIVNCTAEAPCRDELKNLDNAKNFAAELIGWIEFPFSVANPQSKFGFDEYRQLTACYQNCRACCQFELGCIHLAWLLLDLDSASKAATSVNTRNVSFNYWSSLRVRAFQGILSIFNLFSKERWSPAPTSKLKIHVSSRDEWIVKAFWLSNDESFTRLGKVRESWA